MKIGIAIVHFGEQKLLDDCLKSLEPIKYNNIEVWDGNKDNVGFTIGNNNIIKRLRCLGDYDWFWLLNNDTTVPKETLQSIEDKLKDIPSDVGIVGFQIRSMDNPDLIHHAGTGAPFPGGQHKSGSVKLGQFQKERTYEKWVTGASMLIRREVFEKIGLLDENMINYGSDSDFCYRARAAGYSIIYEPSFIIYHKIGQSQNPSPEQQKQIRSDMLYFQNKWISGKLYYDLGSELMKDYK
jgi:N-acetylglucosaminyl-diphospho-decaprenol L-rhamnosyltransferase